MWDLKRIDESIAAEMAKVEAIQAIAKEDGDRQLTDEENREIDSILGTDDKPGKIQALQNNRKRVVKFNTLNASRVSGVAGAVAGSDEASVSPVGKQDDAPKIKVPATARRTGKLRSFKDERDAYASGRFLMAVIGGDQKSKQWCTEHGIQMAHSGDDNSKGGFLVPDVFENALIDLKEEYGQFRQYAMDWPMSSDVSLVPRRVSGFTTYFVGQNEAITTSDTVVDQIKLEAKKLAAMTQFSSELSEDAIISVADFYAREFAYALAVKEDACGFLGDGTSTYGGITGLANALNAGSVAIATGITTFATMTIANFEAAVAKLPMFPGIQPAWYINKAAYHLTMARLQFAAGGNTVSDLSNGPGMSFLGYPVRFVQTLPNAEASNAKIAYFGDLSMAATMGQRRGVTLRADESYYFNQDAIALRVTERFDINVHERGTASAAGPIVRIDLG